MEDFMTGARVVNHAGGTLSQAFIEGEVALPVGKPEMAKVLSVQARVNAGNVEMMENRAMLDGVVTLNICYLCPEGRVHSFESASSFKHNTEVPGALATSKGYANTSVGGIEFTAVDSRRLTISCIVDVTIHVIHEIALAGIAQSAAPEDIIIQPYEKTYQRQVARLSGMVEEKEKISIPVGMPAAEEVLSCDGYAVIKACYTEEGTAAVESEVKLLIVYATEQESTPIAQFYATVPVHEIFSDDNIHPGAKVDAQVRIKEIYCRMSEIGEDMTVELLLAMDAQVYEEFTFKGISDAYSLKNELEIKCQQIDLKQKKEHLSGEYVLRENIEIDSKHAAMRILSVCANMTYPTYRIDKDRISVEAMANVQIVFVDAQGQPGATYLEVPVQFEQEAMGIDSSMTAEISMDFAQMTAAMSGNEIELRAVIDYHMDLYEQSCEQLITAIELGEELKPQKTGIAVCFINQQDSMWDICKRYRMSPESIQTFNPELGERVEPGDKLIVLMRR